MAYFSNGTEGEVFDDQCQKCKYGQRACPIAFAQLSFNYKAVNNKVATDILDMLVRNDGTCNMWDEFKTDLFIDTDQAELFNTDNLKQDIDKYHKLSNKIKEDGKNG